MSIANASKIITGYVFYIKFANAPGLALFEPS